MEQNLQVNVMNENNTEVIINDNLALTNKKSYLCVVMPAYNEEAHIRDNLLETSRIISKFINNYQIIAINDGSTDRTKAGIIEASLMDSHISCISYTANKGKGFAICKGVKYADAEYIAFLDSDLELNPLMLRYFLKALQGTDADIAIGSKLHKKSKLKYPLSRKIMSFGYYLLLKMLFHMDIKDTQTGIKLFKGSVIKPICENLTTDGYAFDIEILAIAAHKGYKIIELPIDLVFKRERRVKSRFTLKTVFAIFRDTLKVKKLLRKEYK
jgi:glycosyltransferase involved in cell wall biosynthesis